MMLEQVVAILAMMVVLFLAIRLFVPQKRRRLMYILTGSILAISICFLGMYLANISFRRQVNMVFVSEAYHDCRLEHKVYRIELPHNTALAYRFSETGAKYISKTKAEGIIQFYQDIAEPNSFTKNTLEDEVDILLSYNGHIFSIVLNEYPNYKDCYLTVDLKR